MTTFANYFSQSFNFSASSNYDNREVNLIGSSNGKKKAFNIWLIISIIIGVLALLIILLIIFIVVKRKKSEEKNAVEYQSDDSVIIPEMEESANPFGTQEYGSFENPLRDDNAASDPFENDTNEDI